MWLIILHVCLLTPHGHLFTLFSDKSNINLLSTFVTYF